jgi:uracil-DNA glycosylase
MSKVDELVILKAECLACRRCPIGGQIVEGKFLSNVFSNMNCEAEILVVGQNPGREETEKQEPFVGVSGKQFDQLAEEVLGLHRSDFYISNTVRCLTPGNRRPTTDEVEACQTFLDREIQILQPKLILSLGGPAFEQLTGMHGIMKHHGSPTFSPRHKVFVFPLLHPSPINLNDPAKLELFVEDLVKLDRFIKGGCVP